MKKQDLPKTFKGYPVGELLQAWNMLQGDGIPEGTDIDKIDAMQDLLREYKIAPVFWDDDDWTEEDLAAKEQELWALLRSYGIEPAGM